MAENEEKTTTPTTPAPEETKPAETPPADEKALSDTLMEELKTATPEPAPKKSKLSLPKFSLGKKKQPVEVAPPPEPATPEAQQLTNEALMEMIDDKLEKISGDEFITIKISKPGLLILVGAILVILWAVPSLHLLPKISNPFKSVKLPTLPFMNKPSPTPTPSTTPEAPPATTEVKIRVRMGADSLEAANEIKSLLSSTGATLIDVVTDNQVNPKQVLVVTREDQQELRQQLTGILSQKYSVSSESATLTEDSDFTATILVGKNALLKK